ncbi:hypothetical protein [Xenorhabdus stockiae]|uniref:hypothetical protein n=1 Tax=Xenorhabdus stockiae TaxID=351614 RepID=UPI004062D46D
MGRCIACPLAAANMQGIPDGHGGRNTGQGKLDILSDLSVPRLKTLSVEVKNV